MVNLTADKTKDMARKARLERLSASQIFEAHLELNSWIEHIKKAASEGRRQLDLYRYTCVYGCGGDDIPSEIVRDWLADRGFKISFERQSDEYGGSNTCTIEWG